MLRPIAAGDDPLGWIADFSSAFEDASPRLRRDSSFECLYACPETVSIVRAGSWDWLAIGRIELGDSSAASSPTVEFEGERDCDAEDSFVTGRGFRVVSAAFVEPCGA